MSAMRHVHHRSGGAGSRSWPLWALLLWFCVGAACAQGASPTDLVAKGRALAIAADCAACHTDPKGGAAFAGGYAIATPLGPIYSSNISPSKTHGIGSYTLEEFTRAVRQGVRKDGTHLYPAMPYTSYTLIRDEDVAALYAFMMQGVTPVDQPARQTQLSFPFSQRYLMAFWNALFLSDKRYVPDTAKSPEWNRGAYIAHGLAHCSTCHTPRNILWAERGDAFLAGGSLGTWYAPNITSDPVAGVGGWTVAELAQYLKTGRVHAKGQAAGPMAEAVADSFQHLPDSDLTAIATFLKEVPPKPDEGGITQPRYSFGTPDTATLAKGDAAQAADPGWQVFNTHCAACHQAEGQGNQVFPSLFHNTATVSGRGDNLITVVLNGANYTVNGTTVDMPAFASSLSDQQIADLSSFIFKQFGDPHWHFSATDVQTLRAGGPTPFLVRIAPAIGPTLAVLALLVVAMVWAYARRRRRRRR